MERAAARSAAACGARHHFDGHTTWTLAVHADAQEHLVQALRDTARDTGLMMP
jgi:hypothetical protein